ERLLPLLLPAQHTLLDVCRAGIVEAPLFADLDGHVLRPLAADEVVVREGGVEEILGAVADLSDARVEAGGDGHRRKEHGYVVPVPNPALERVAGVLVLL